MTIAAIFATHNRADTAVECLRALLDGVRRPEVVVIADNASTDGTAARLRDAAAAQVNSGVEVLELSENCGNAGGIQRAMNRAFEKGADAVWILDDDSIPARDALAALLAPRVWDGPRTSLVLDSDTGDLAWPLICRSSRHRERAARGLAELPQGDTFEVVRSWLGALVPKSVFLKVGPVNGDFFLRGEDEDYPRRIAAAGYAFLGVRGSILRHPPVGRVMLVNLFGTRLAVEPELEGVKLYYRLRNGVFIIKNSSGRLKAGLWALIQWGAHTCIRGMSGSWNRTFWRGVVDGWRGRLGRMKGSGKF